MYTLVVRGRWGKTKNQWAAGAGVIAPCGGCGRGFSGVDVDGWRGTLERRNRGLATQTHASSDAPTLISSHSGRGLGLAVVVVREYYPLGGGDMGAAAGFFVVRPASPPMWGKQYIIGHALRWWWTWSGR